MTEILFASFFLVVGGYIVGKLFIGFNPFLMIIGFIALFSFSTGLIEVDNTFYTACFIFGAALHFIRPISYVHNLLQSLNLKRFAPAYSPNLAQQKKKYEEELYKQKQQVEEELRRQKREAEEDIERQRKEAEDKIKREAENLRREKEKHKQSHQSKDENRHLNPLVFSDACEILGMAQGKTLKEYRAAYKKLVSQYHADKLTGLSEDLIKQEEEKAKTLNIAIDTIKKKLR